MSKIKTEIDYIAFMHTCTHTYVREKIGIFYFDSYFLFLF